MLNTRTAPKAHPVGIGRSSPDKVRERELLRLAAEMIPKEKTSKDPFSLARSIILSWASKQVGSDLPPDALKGRPFEHLRGGRPCIGTAIEDDNLSCWAIRVDRPDSRIPQRTWTTEAALGSSGGGPSLLISLRLLVSTPEKRLDIELAVPALLRKLADSFRLFVGGEEIVPKPLRVNSLDEVEGLIQELTSPERRLPYVVCSIHPNEDAPRVNARTFAKATFGIARTVVVPSEYTWELTGLLGRSLSVYNGAVRIFNPEFTQDSNPYAHRLLHLDNEGASQRAQEAARTHVAGESLRRFRLGEDVLEFSFVRNLYFRQERRGLEQSGSHQDELISSYSAQVEQLESDLRRAKDEADFWSQEAGVLDEDKNNLERQLSGARQQISHLIQQLKSQGSKPDSNIALPTTWLEFSEWCDQHLEGRVTLSSRARREVRSPEYRSPETAARCLLWLANEYRDAKLEGSGDALHKVVEEGIHNAQCGADSFLFPWNGDQVYADWHIKSGGNTRDPQRCLRIYYFWDEQSQMVVVASMPAHIRTEAT